MNDNKELTAGGTKQELSVVFTFDEEGELIKPYLSTTHQDSTNDLARLSPEESEQLKKCEEDIKEHYLGFVSVGYSLHQIWSKKLYRATHTSFEQYCKEKWGMCRFHASRLIKASQVAATLEKAHQVGALCKLPTEACARVLTNLTPEEQIKVVKRVKENVGDRKPNATDFRVAKDEVVGKKTPTLAVNCKQTGPSNDESNPATTEVKHRTTLPTAGRPAVLTPAEFYKGKQFLTLQQLSEKANHLENIRSNSGKKEEFERTLFKVREGLALYAEWEMACLHPTSEQEAA